MLPLLIRNAIKILIACCTVAVSVGCSHAEYDLLQPQDLAQHIGTKQTVTAPMPPLEYRMLAYESHLVMRIYNRSEETIQFVAPQSTVVDPNGQSHPLPIQSQMILPGSYIKLILPPTRGGAVVPSGPTIGIGIGGVFGSARGYRSGYGLGFAGDPFFYDRPRYYAVYGAGDQSVYWSWSDGGAARLVLAYRRAPSGAASVGGSGAVHAPLSQPAGESAPPPSEEPRGDGSATFTHQFVFKRQSV